MEARDTIEFYYGKNLVAAVDSSMTPSVGSFINIRKSTWEVKRVTFALDHADDIALRRMRCSVDIEPVSK